ncbi:hypothetical protein MUN81_13785 [Hymenobacter sp. 5317J-9]|uniref:hypothetical protein n=1 Tax=Hymenobacter sp. 5317J-9 TaxID=2932250 RepID=UPI001FD6E400|nr:hypothetical protein [Hymenobacter sp. 5317J-9]UOQ96320.1 hypothetical protein MUN81_13785 [Hymenobacter sp. 5317J-9]
MRPSVLSLWARHQFHLAGPKARHDFPGVGHEPYWHRYPADWEQQTRAFLSR